MGGSTEPVDIVFLCLLYFVAYLGSRFAIRRDTLQLDLPVFGGLEHVALRDDWVVGRHKNG